MLTIDGARGEGGGQILRSALALSAITGTAVRVERIRARRQKPGLLPQHLAAVRAATRIADAEVDGDRLGSRELVFRPRRVRAGTHDFAVGTAGSATLVLQTILPPLLLAGGSSHLTLEGGTHNRFAPPFEFLSRAVLPLIARMGPTVSATLERPGFYPAGGGRFTVDVTPVPRLTPLSLHERGAIRRRHARALVARLPRTIAERELAVVSQALGWTTQEQEAVVADSMGPGNAVMLEIECEHATEVFTGFGERGLPAESVALTAVQEAQTWLTADVPVGTHLADQLLLPMALAGAGAFRTLPLTQHSTTNMDVIRAFLPVSFVAREGGGRVNLEVT